MKNQFIAEVTRQMLPFLDNAQLARLQAVLQNSLTGLELTQEPDAVPAGPEHSNEEFLQLFLAAKQVEGCSAKTIRYYRAVLGHLFSAVSKPLTSIQTEDLRSYLAVYQQRSQCSNSNVDNIRRIISSLFSWLEDEDFIIKSPVRRIHKIKSGKLVREIYSDESLEALRDHCTCLRDLALIDTLASTGMRVGELVKLNRKDIDFANRECVVFGKGSKERIVYFDARTKLHLQNYLNSRTDDNPALFVSLQKPFRRLEISGVEIRLRQLGQKLGIRKVHPHKFRRTLATQAIDKGMPIEQVQMLLGHSKIDTTMRYAMVDQHNVKLSHRKFISCSL